LFKATVIQLGMTNAPADFQCYINDPIREALDDFPSAYLDHDPIYSDSGEEHVEHINWIMQRLLEAELYFKPDICECHKETVSYFVLIISTKGISMDEHKVQTVRHWSREKETNNQRLHNHFQVQQILVLYNYYR